jgi:long-chain-acyl-CoA dehydrogenase
VRRGLHEADHEAFRESVAEFVRREVAPHVERWDEDGLTGREVWHVAGKQGVIGLSAPGVYGGAGAAADYRFRNVVHEELAKVFAASLGSGFSLQDDIAIPYLVDAGTEEQKQRWLPGMCSGELIGAIAMTEPGTGSDLRGIRTSAARVDGGWLVNGAKTFITNGIQSDLVITVARTDPAGGRDAFTLLVVERGMPGFSRGRKLEKLGLRAQDTAELILEDVFVPDANRLGAEGSGLAQLQAHLPLERLSIAAHAIAVAAATLASTVEYTRQRSAFGRPVADFQNTRFRLADLVTDLEVTQAYVDRAIVAFGAGDLTAVDAAKAKLAASEMQGRIVDQCVQLHGGYGYMLDYPVARAFRDARVQRIFGGTSEIMRHIIGRDLVDGGLDS